MKYIVLCQTKFEYKKFDRLLLVIIKIVRNDAAIRLPIYCPDRCKGEHKVLGVLVKIGKATLYAPSLCVLPPFTYFFFIFAFLSFLVPFLFIIFPFFPSRGTNNILLWSKM